MIIGHKYIRRRILFLQDKYLKNGGTERYISIKRAESEQHGHQTFLFTLTEEKDLRIKNSKILSFKENRFFGSYTQMIRVYFSLKKYIKKINPHLVYIQNNYEFPYAFIRACRNYKTIQMVHDYGIICPSRWCVYKDNLKLCDGKMGIKCLKHKCISSPSFLSYYLKLKYLKTNKIIQKYIAPSKILRKYMLNNGYKDVKFVPHPFNINSGKEKIRRNKNLFLYIGGLYKHKGVHLLIDAMREVVKIKPKVKLEILGSGLEEQNLKNRIKKYELDKNINFVGKVEHKELYKYYKGATATIVPSIWVENYPYVVVESIHFKTPVIGSDLGGIKEQITDEKKGILFKRNDKRDLIKKIISKCSGC